MLAQAGKAGSFASLRNGNAKAATEMKRTAEWEMKSCGTEMRKQDLEIVIECLADKKAEFFVA
jgi:hypothetical protein